MEFCSLRGEIIAIIMDATARPDIIATAISTIVPANPIKSVALDPLALDDAATPAAIPLRAASDPGTKLKIAGIIHANLVLHLPNNGILRSQIS